MNNVILYNFYVDVIFFFLHILIFTYRVLDANRTNINNKKQNNFFVINYFSNYLIPIHKNDNSCASYTGIG